MRFITATIMSYIYGFRYFIYRGTELEVRDLFWSQDLFPQTMNFDFVNLQSFPQCSSWEHCQCNKCPRFLFMMDTRDFLQTERNFSNGGVLELQGAAELGNPPL